MTEVSAEIYALAEANTARHEPEIEAWLKANTDPRQHAMYLLGCAIGRAYAHGKHQLPALPPDLITDYASRFCALYAQLSVCVTLRAIVDTIESVGANAVPISTLKTLHNLHSANSRELAAQTTNLYMTLFEIREAPIDDAGKQDQTRA